MSPMERRKRGSKWVMTIKTLRNDLLLKVKPDTRMRQVRHFKPSVIEKLKAMKKDMKTSIISTDQFNNKKQKQNKEKKK